ncbi:hypothetical protein [Actinomadura fibrosa]|uniref:hypothetical protein n=1 Tax=Actinomadura fibrosa TaxID=111802 RepID=UPI0010412065|nr:hypothetical protein [Actinomadura fibrosa]
MQSTIVMTGASRGIGRAAERILSQAPDVHLVVAGRAGPRRRDFGGRGVSHVDVDLGSRRTTPAASANCGTPANASRHP